MLLLGLALLGAPTAEAGALYINGVRADGVVDLEMKSVNIRIDANGDMWIDAPRYQVEVVQPGGLSSPSGTPPAAAPPTTSSAPPPAATAPVATQPAPAPQTAPVATAPVSRPAAPTTTAAVPQGSWWLVTDDNASTGHIVDVYVRGVLVHTVKSGDEQVLMDISRYLQGGGNQVQFTARAGNQPGGGVLHIYVGQGTTVDGTLNLASPEIEFTRRSSDSPAGTSRQYQLDIR